MRGPDSGAVPPRDAGPRRIVAPERMLVSIAASTLQVTRQPGLPFRPSLVIAFATVTVIPVRSVQ